MFFIEYIVPVLVLAGVGLIFGAVIAVLSKVFHVEEDKRVETVLNMLPGYNCGACGYPGCNAFSKAIVEEGKPVNDCKPIRQDQADLIREFLKNNS